MSFTLILWNCTTHITSVKQNRLLPQRYRSVNHSRLSISEICSLLGALKRKSNVRKQRAAHCFLRCVTASRRWRIFHLQRELVKTNRLKANVTELKKKSENCVSPPPPCIWVICNASCEKSWISMILCRKVPCMSSFTTSAGTQLYCICRINQRTVSWYGESNQTSNVGGPLLVKSKWINKWTNCTKNTFFSLNVVFAFQSCFINQIPSCTCGLLWGEMQPNSQLYCLTVLYLTVLIESYYFYLCEQRAAVFSGKDLWQSFKLAISWWKKGFIIWLNQLSEIAAK